MQTKNYTSHFDPPTELQPQHSKQQQQQPPPSIDYRRVQAFTTPSITGFMPRRESYKENGQDMTTKKSMILEEEEDDEESDEEDEYDDEIVENVSTPNIGSSTFLNDVGLRKRITTTTTTNATNTANAGVDAAKSKCVRFESLPKPNSKNAKLMLRTTDHFAPADDQSDAITHASSELTLRQQHRQLYRRNVINTKLKKIVFNGTYPIDDPYSSRFRHDEDIDDDDDNDLDAAAE